MFCSTTLRHGPFIAGVCSAIGFTASSITWYRFTACRFHSLTMAIFVVPNAGLLYYFTDYEQKHAVTLPTTSGKLSENQAIMLSTKIQLVYGSVIPVITASYPFIGSNWTKGRKLGLTFSKHIGIQMKDFFLGFSLRKSKRYYRLLLINVILQFGVGALLGYNQVVERNLVKSRVFKDDEILPEYKDLFLQESRYPTLKRVYRSVVDELRYNLEIIFPPAK